MPASLQILASDGTTVITTDNEGAIPSPGSSTPTKYFVKNVGDALCSNLTLTIQSVGSNNGVLYGLIAPDSAGSPGTFITTPITVGTLAAGASSPFWAKSSLTAGLTPSGNPLRWNIHASGNSL